MSWTQPQTVVDLFTGVPLDPDYNQTVLFNAGSPDNDTVETQLNFFKNNYLYGTWQNVSYIRPSSGSIRLELVGAQTFEGVRSCNYMRFCNYDSNRTYYDGGPSSIHNNYYAFINFVEYVNEKTFEISFTIDPLQTYMFNYTINQCFIERQHSTTDAIGDNLISESFDLGNNYVINTSQHKISSANSICILINRVNAVSGGGTSTTHITGDGVEVTFELSVHFDTITRVFYPDGTNITDYTYDSSTYEITFDEAPADTVVIAIQGTITGQTTTSTLSGGVYTPCEVHSFSNLVNSDNPGEDETSITTVDQFLDQYNESDIICVYQYPSFIGSVGSEVGTSLTISKPATLDGYTPKNNKLFTYPYSYLQASNHSGSIATYNWELFNDKGANAETFVIDGNIVGLAELCMVPSGYRGISNEHATYNYDYDSALTLSTMPQCAWAGDTFKAWWAQNKAGFVMSAVTGALGGAGSAYSGGYNLGSAYKAQIPSLAGSSGASLSNIPIGGLSGAMTSAAPAIGLAVAGVNLATSAAGAMAKIYDIKHTPSQTHGQTQTEHLNTKHGIIGFSLYTMSITASIARTIDDYFSRFGYAQHTISTPNRNVRPVFTYVQTQGCTINGAVPAEYEKEICKIYDKGITWWKKSYATHMGEYYNYFNTNKLS